MREFSSLEMNSGSCVSRTWCFARVEPSSTLMSAPWKRKLWRGLGSQLDRSSAALDRLWSGGEWAGGSRECAGVSADRSPRCGARPGDRCAWAASPGPMRGVMAGEGSGGAALSVWSTPSWSKRPLRRGVYAGGSPPRGVRDTVSFCCGRCPPSSTSHPATGIALHPQCASPSPERRVDVLNRVATPPGPPRTPSFGQ